MNPAARTWAYLSASFWFVPGLVVLGSIAVAAVLIQFGDWELIDLAEWAPHLFGAGAAGSAGMLSAIATAMATVAGVVFSITMVTLSLSASQYSPGVLRNFMRDRPTQLVLGIFVGIFAYCLVVLRTIRGGDEGGFVPSLAVLGGLVYALIGVALLIYFIHHIALVIQPATILQRIGRDTATAIDQLFPQQLGSPDPEAAGDICLPARWQPVRAARNGYVAQVDADALLSAAVEGDRLLRLRIPVGGYVSEGQVLVELGGDVAPSDAEVRRLCGCIRLASQRTLQQDPGYGLHQLMDVALHALSPGNNDPGTAAMCVDQIGSLLERLADRRIPGPLRFHEGRLRVIAPTPDFAAICDMTLRPVVQQAGGDLLVIAPVLNALERVVAVAATQERRRALDGVVGDLHAELAQLRPRSRARAAVKRLRALR